MQSEAKLDSLVPLKSGDLVVTRVPESASHYAVRQHPGAVQFTASPREEAIRLARGFARAHGVDAWISEDAGSSRIESGRAARSGDGSEPRQSKGA
jgi:hypothetical protein